MTRLNATRMRVGMFADGQWVFCLTLILTVLIPVSCLGMQHESESTQVPLQPQLQGESGNYFFNPDLYFRRLATFPVYLNTDIELETVAEIVAATRDGRTLVYTDSEAESVGFVDISNPRFPKPSGSIGLSGEPTSVATVKMWWTEYALVAVNTSANFVDTSGFVAVIDIAERKLVRRIRFDGQPDSIAVSNDRRYAAIAIENERDEDLGDGEPPQLPAGFVEIIDIQGRPRSWKTRRVELTGIADEFPDDPEPEFIDINNRNVAAVSLQENNHIVFINLRSGRIVGDFNAGSVDLDQIDNTEDERINQTQSLVGVPREPDAIAWVSDTELATANEGDLFGGSRGFSIFRRSGKLLWDSGNTLEHLTARIGHYPEDRSENKGNEPEGLEYASYGLDRYLFVGSERSSVIFVYRLPTLLRRIFFGQDEPELIQVLPASAGPEGLLAIPRRSLFVVASEVDDREGKIRSAISIYRLFDRDPTYPTLVSADREDGTPIPWAALSALAADKFDASIAYTAYDSFFQDSRIFTIDVGQSPAVITEEIPIVKEGEFVDLDVEGLSTREDGGFWVASEGAGSVDDPDRPVVSPNLLVLCGEDGTVFDEVMLPPVVNGLQRRFGFEGVASVGSGLDEELFVAFQREWVDDPDGLVRIGRYHVANETWRFYYYPLDMPESPNGGWVGLSEIVSLGDDEFAVIERDNQGNTDARIKRVYRFSIDELEPGMQGGVFPIVSKVFVRDLLPDLEADNGFPIEKVEGLTVLANGDSLIVTDNDGVDDNSGESQLLNLGNIFGAENDE